jgi:hypothetical protein
MGLAAERSTTPAHHPGSAQNEVDPFRLAEPLAPNAANGIGAPIARGDYYIDRYAEEKIRWGILPWKPEPPPSPPDSPAPATAATEPVPDPSTSGAEQAAGVVRPPPETPAER